MNQYNEHVWAWRQWRFHMRGLYAFLREVGW